MREVRELGSLAWDYGPVGEDAVVSGTVAIVRDGRIAELYTYLTKAPGS